MSEIQKLYDLQQQLKTVKAAEIKQRLLVAGAYLGDNITEKQVIEVVVGQFDLKIVLGETLKIDNPRALVNLAQSDELDEYESAALELKPAITLAKLNKLEDPDSVLWDHCHVEMAGTPTVTITRND